MLQVQLLAIYGWYLFFTLNKPDQGQRHIRMCVQHSNDYLRLSATPHFRLKMHVCIKSSSDYVHSSIHRSCIFTFNFCHSANF